MNARQLDLIIYTSAVALAAGVFLPLTRLPLVGDVTYFRIAELEAGLVIVLCFLTGALLVGGRAKLTLIPALGIWVTLFYPAIEQFVRAGNSRLADAVTDRAGRIMAEFAADLFMNIAEFSWGGLLFVIALVSLTLSALVRCFR